MAKEPTIFREIKDFDRANSFARILSKERCWFGYLDDVTDLDTLYSKIDGRLASYRRFHQANPPHLPEFIKSTKTRIAEPIFRVAACLRKSGVVNEDVPIFVRIDQIEELYRSDDLRPELGIQYRRVINKALSMREAKISFRLGTRKYAWSDDITIYGTETAMEIERDYRVIDIDDILRRKENVKWIFPKFAEDIFRRRLAFAKVPIDPNGKNSLRTIMRATPKPPVAAAEYAGHSEARRALKFERYWPKHWITFLTALFERDPLSAKLAEAWLRQGTHAEIKSKLKSRLAKKGNYPWERPYWKKERVRQALMQLAARCAQRLMWSGEENIIALSTGSTLMFVSLCQHIWDAFLRSERGKLKQDRTDLLLSGIDRRVQAVAIQTASTYWYHKIAEQPGGSDRKRFIDRVGRVLYESLINDRAMSYPGYNGFSLSIEQLESDTAVARFLGDAVDYGDLYDAPHTTKLKDAKQRVKWYLNPILSPHFRIPETHVKEPIYVSIADVKKWMKEAQIPIIYDPKQTTKRRKRPEYSDLQMSLLETPAQKANK